MKIFKTIMCVLLISCILAGCEGKNGQSDQTITNEVNDQLNEQTNEQENSNIIDDEIDKSEMIVNSKADINGDGVEETIVIYRKKDCNEFVLSISEENNVLFQRVVFNNSMNEIFEIKLVDVTGDGVLDLLLQGEKDNYSNSLRRCSYELYSVCDGELIEVSLDGIVNNKNIVLSMISESLVKVSIKGAKDYVFTLPKEYEYKDYKNYKGAYYKGNLIRVDKNKYVMYKTIRDLKININMSFTLDYVYENQKWIVKHVLIKNNGDLLVDEDVI